MLFGGAVDTLIGDGLFPVAEVSILCCDVRELMSFESVDLDIVDVALDLAFVLRSIGACRNDGGLIVFCESKDLGMEFDPST